MENLNFLVKYLSCVIIIAMILRVAFYPIKWVIILASVSLNIWDIILSDILLFSQMIKHSHSCKKQYTLLNFLNPDVKTFDGMGAHTRVRNGYDVAVDYSEHHLLA